MKELSIEEKAKRYDEALKYAKIYYTNGNEDMKMMMKTCFPVLVEESEDERIRKELLEHCRKQAEMYNTLLTAKEYSEVQSWIAWLEKQGEHDNFINKIQIGDKVTRNEDGVLVNLSQLKRVAKKDEKQGEQKDADKVEPKFKIEKGKCYVCIRDLDDNYGTRAFYKGSTYYSTKNETLLPDNSNVPFEIKYCVNDYFRLWTIQDAKDGDVLVASDGSIFLFAGVVDLACKYYVALTTEDVIKFNEGLEHYWETSRAARPATKEQCTLLFSKIKESGYEWNAGTKELKKIEQKPAWSEEDEYCRHQLIVFCENCIVQDTNARRCADWLKSLKPQNTWKPSDEQMRVLNLAIRCGINRGTTEEATLVSLFNDLKKLK